MIGQKLAAKRIPALQELSYRDRLTALNLEWLEHCCLRLDLCLLYRIIFGMCDIDLNGILVLRGDFPTRGHRYKVMQEHGTNNYRKNFFVQRVAPIWNSLHHPLSTSVRSLDSNSRWTMST